MAYLSLERLCLQSLGLGRVMPTARYSNLSEFEMYQQALLGEGATALLHGQGFASDDAAVGAMDGAAAAARIDRSNPATFLCYHNSGQHHPRSIKRTLPAADASNGPKLHCLLNFFGAAVARAGSVTFAPSEGLLITLCDMGCDGLMLGAGAMLDEQDLSIVGLQRRVRVAEAGQVLDMDDAQRAEWYRGNPALQTAVRASPLVARAASTICPPAIPPLHSDDQLCLMKTA